MLGESLLELVERDFRIALGFGVSIQSWVQSGGGVLFLCGLLQFEFRQLLDINEP